MNRRMFILPLLLAALCCAGCAAPDPTGTTGAVYQVVYTDPTPTETQNPPRVYAAPSLPTAWLVNCKEFLYLWDSPDTNKILKTLSPGDPLILLGWNGMYAHVRKDDTEGYVLSNYIKPADNLWELLQVVSPTDTYTYAQMTSDINRLCSLYPESCSVSIIGSSELGKEIPALIIGNTTARKHVLLHGSIHGREHMTTWLLMAMADCWLNNNLDCLADICYHIIPMVNPDGVEISQSGTLNETQSAIYQRDRYRKYTTDPIATYATHWKANAMGVDLNRNFPAGWEFLAGPAAPSSQQHIGSTPFCAAESIALRDYTLNHSFSATVSYHAFGSIIYYEYGNRQPANDLSLELALAVEQVTGYLREGSLNVQGGGYKDWAIDSLGIPSLTVEIGCQKTPLPQEELYSIFARNLFVLPAIAQWLTQ